MLSWWKNLRMGHKQSNAIRKPKLIIFDLNFTLWSANINCHEAKPFTKNSDGQVVDPSGRPVTYYREVPDILELLQKEGYTMAVASRNEWPEEERTLLHLFEFDDYFAYKEIYIGCKTNHIKSIQAESGISYEDMLLFDDSKINVRTVSELGVTCVHVKKGLSFEVMQDGLETFAGLVEIPVSKERQRIAHIQVQHLLKSYKVYKTYSKLK